MSPRTMQVVSLPFAMPGNFQSLRAYYWTLNRIAESMNDSYNAPITDPIDAQLNDWMDNVRLAQGAVANAVKEQILTDKFDTQLKVALLLHWAGECGDEIADQLKVITDELARKGVGE